MKILNFERFSFGVIIIAAIMVIAGVTFVITENKQNAAISKQTDTTNALIKQVKEISERNESLNQENKDYAYCTAQLIAAYTRDQKPITIDDLRTCALSSFNDGDLPSAVSASTDSKATQEIQLQDGSTVEIQRPSSSQTTTNNSTTNNTTTNNPTTNNTTTQPAQNSSPILTVPNLLNLQTPCVNAANLLKTC